MSRTNSMSLPDIKGDETFDSLVQKLARYLVRAVQRPTTFDDFRKSQSHVLTPLSKYLVSEVHHPALIAALITLRGHFAATEDDSDEGTNDARSAACEVVALRYTSHLSERDAIDSLLYELPPPKLITPLNEDSGRTVHPAEPLRDERTPLLGRGSWRSASRRDMSTSIDGIRSLMDDYDAVEINLAESLQNLNALEIAAVSGAKKFLSQRPIQRIITAIWDGDIIFWSNLQADATKQVQIYRKHSADPYSRLRVPKYLKAFEVLFFLGLLALYYIVLVQRSFHDVTTAEILLYIWLGSFAYNEVGEFWDAGIAFYLSDFWTLWDLGIVGIGAAFFVCRMVGLSNGNTTTIDTAFDILSMEALVLVPRLCSLLSLHPYFGTLLPCLKEMTKDFLKFLSLVVILYLGFLTTFSLLARGHFTGRQMSWILIKVFFGSSYLGFDVAEQISPILGPPLMLVFVCLTNILLVTSLISILSNSLTKVIQHARDEYLFVYSVFVLEASTSNRLTYFLPPLNLIPLVLRPIRLFLPAEKLRTVRIALLRATHFPHVCAIMVYENLRRRVTGRQVSGLPLSATAGATTPEPPRRYNRYSRGHRLSTPQPLAAAHLKRNVLQPSFYDNSTDGEMPEATDMTSDDDLRVILTQLARQVESLTQRLDGVQHNE